ncbi:MAG: hypothetical protein OHK0047_32140 [Leptolyngbyaceae cyanobacterium]
MKLTSLSDLPAEFVSHNPEIQKKVMLRPGDLPHLTNFSQARLAPGQIASAHQHIDMYEVFFVMSGVGVITLDRTPYALTPGVCVAVEPGETHEVKNTGDEELVLTYFGVLA